MAFNALMPHDSSTAQIATIANLSLSQSMPRDRDNKPFMEIS